MRAGANAITDGDADLVAHGVAHGLTDVVTNAGADAVADACADADLPPGREPQRRSAVRPVRGGSFQREGERVAVHCVSDGEVHCVAWLEGVRVLSDAALRY